MSTHDSLTAKLASRLCTVSSTPHCWYDTCAAVCICQAARPMPCLLGPSCHMVGPRCRCGWAHDTTGPMDQRHVAHFGVLSLAATQADNLASIQAYCRCCDHIETPSFLMRVISPGSDVCLAHILEDQSSRGCIIACFDSLAQHGFAVPTCFAGTHRSSGIAEVVADWASRLLGPTLLKHSYTCPDPTSLQAAVSSIRGFVQGSGRTCMPTASLTQLLLMGEQLDPASLPLTSISAQQTPDRYDARSGVPRGMALVADGPGLLQLREAWDFCLNTAAKTPGSLFRCVLASRDAQHIAPRPLPSPRIPQPPTPPLPPRQRAAPEPVERLTECASAGPLQAAAAVPHPECPSDSGAPVSLESAQTLERIQQPHVDANDHAYRCSTGVPQQHQQPSSSQARVSSPHHSVCRSVGTHRRHHFRRPGSRRGKSSRRGSRSRGGVLWPEHTPCPQ